MAKEASLEDCLKLLRGASDEERLVGLLVATKFVKGDDADAVRQVFEAIGFKFINRLLKTGLGQADKGKDKRQAYLHLALSILAAFCRLPELVTSEEVIDKVPVLLITLGEKEDEAAAGDCYECLLAVAVASDKGLQALIEFKALPVIVNQLLSSAPEAPWFAEALKLLHILVVKLAAENGIGEYSQDLAYVIPAGASQLAFRQDTVKFGALAILYSLLVSDISAPIRVALGDSVKDSEWLCHARTGMGQILHSRVAVEQKYLVLELAEAIAGLVGEMWLVGSMDFPGEQGRAPPERFFVLVVETLKVETAVLLNDIAQAAFDTGIAEMEVSQSSKAGEAGFVQQRRLMKCFALLEYVISIMVSEEGASKDVSQTVLQKTMVGLDEVVGVVLEFLEDAQRHNRNQGDTVMASVRIVSRYLAEAPSAHQQRCHKLLAFMLSASTSSDTRQFLAVQFMLPYLTQLTLDSNGCMVVVASGSHIEVVKYFSWSVLGTQEAKGSLVDTCDILLNILTKQGELKGLLRADNFIPVIFALVVWVGQGLPKVESAMAASVLTSILTLTDEEQLKKSSHVGPRGMQTVLQVIVLNVEHCFKADRSEELSDEGLLEIFLSGLVACMDRYPSFQPELRARLQSIMGNRDLSQIQYVTTNPSLQQLLLTVLR